MTHRACDEGCEGRCQDGDDEQESGASPTAGELTPEAVAAADLLQDERSKAQHCGCSVVVVKMRAMNAP